MSYKTRPMTLADFMDFIEPALKVPQHHRKTLLSGPAWTVCREGKIICCYGFAPLMYGCAEAWMLLSDEGQGLPVRVYRQAKMVMASVIQSQLFRRIQATVLADNEKHRKFVERLGFHVEGSMEKFGENGETYLRYVIFP